MARERERRGVQVGSGANLGEYREVSGGEHRNAHAGEGGVSEPLKCLLTGGAGFIGSHPIQPLLRHTNWNIVCLDRLDSAGSLNRLYSMPSWGTHRHRVAYRHHDLRAAISHNVAGEILGAFGMKPFDRVLHLAAGSHVDRSVSEPTLFVLDKVLGTEHL